MRCRHMRVVFKDRLNRLRASEDFFHEENPSAEFDFDFFELVPKSVYAGVEQEDIW